MAIEPEHPQDHIDRLLFSLSSLSDIAETLTSTGDFNATLRSLLHLVLGVLTISKGAVLLFDPPRKTLSVRTARGLGRSRPSIRLEDEWMRGLIRENRPLLKTDLAGLFPQMTADYAQQLENLQAHLWIPLVAQKRLVGVLSLSERFMQQPYTEQDLNLLATMARHIAVGISNHNLIEDVRTAGFTLNRKVLELETLYDVGMAMTSELDIDALTDEILVRLISILDLRAGFLLLTDEATGQLQTAARFGVEEPDIRRLCLSESGDLIGRALETGVSHIANHFGETQADAPCQHLMLIPLKTQEEVIGLLGVMDKESRETDLLPFTDEDEHLASSFANQAGIAVSNARLYRNILDVKNYNQNILASISSGVISTDLEGRIVSANRAAQRILGLDADSIEGMSCQSIANRLGNDEILSLMQTALDTGVGGQLTQLACQVGNNYLVLDVRVSPLIDQHDVVGGLVIAMDDLSEENRIRSIFKRYVSDRVVDMVLKPDTSLTLGGEVRDIVVIFTDLRGFTRMQEEQGPEETVSMLNEYYEAMVDVIVQHNGTLSRIAGDGLMILYGAPIAFDDEMGRAIQTTLDMQDALSRLNERRTVEGKEPLGMGIGISAGRVIAGNIGSHQRMEYTVIGDPVNLAARLVDIADSNQILVSEDVFRQIKDRFHTQHFRTIRVKGKQRPVSIYELKGAAAHDHAHPETEKETVMKKPSGEVDLTIPLLPEMELAASKTAAAVAEFIRLDENKIEEIRLALIEACVNAIEHSKSKDRKVHINFVIHDDELEIIIQDFGEGFDVEDIRQRMAERASDEKLLKRGWGLTIMEELMDEVDVQSGQKGTTIRMIKRR